MSKSLKHDNKVNANGGKAMGLKSQPVSGKLKGGDASSMPGSKGKGQAVKTVQSNPISGKTVQKGATAMGSGDVIKGFV